MEYFVVIIIFLIFSVYFALRLIEFYPEYLKNVKEEILRSDVYRLSEMLVNDDGEPAGWTGMGTGSIKRIGLSDQLYNQSNLVDITKVIDLENKCNNEYDNIKRLVGAKHDFYLVVNDISSGTVYECGSMITGESVAVVRRVIAFDNDDYGKMIVYMWW